MRDQMTDTQFNTLMGRLDRLETNMDRLETNMDRLETNMSNIEANMVKKSDVFQSVLTVQGFTVAIIVGVIVVLNSVVGFS